MNMYFHPLQQQTKKTEIINIYWAHLWNTHERKKVTVHVSRSSESYNINTPGQGQKEEGCFKKKLNSCSHFFLRINLLVTNAMW